MTPTFPYIDFDRARAEEKETVNFTFPGGPAGQLVEQGGYIVWAWASKSSHSRAKIWESRSGGDRP
jgi:hypothetical protein